MPDGLKTRQINALRLLLGRREFLPQDIAALDYHTLVRVPGIGGKGLNLIREWLHSYGLDLLNSPGEFRDSLQHFRQEARIQRARNLLEKHGYSILPPTERR